MEPSLGRLIYLPKVIELMNISVLTSGLSLRLEISTEAPASTLSVSLQCLSQLAGRKHLSMSTVGNRGSRNKGSLCIIPHSVKDRSMVKTAILAAILHHWNFWGAILCSVPTSPHYSPRGVLHRLPGKMWIEALWGLIYLSSEWPQKHHTKGSRCYEILSNSWWKVSEFEGNY